MENQSNFNLTPYQIEILKYLLKVRIADIYQIIKNVNGGKGRSYTSTLLTALKHQKMIDGCYWDTKRIFFLEKQGVQYFRDINLIPKEIDLPTINESHEFYWPNHDLLLTNVYASLGSLPGIIKILTHNEQILYKNNANPFDCLIEVQKNDKQYTLALELESHRCHPSIYEKAFKDHYNNGSISLVLYLVPDDHLKRDLWDFDKELLMGDKSHIFIGLTPDFFLNPSTAKFENRMGKIFNFQSLQRLDSHQTIEAKS